MRVQHLNQGYPRVRLSSFTSPTTNPKQATKAQRFTFIAPVLDIKISIHEC